MQNVWVCKKKISQARGDTAAKTPEPVTIQSWGLCGLIESLHQSLSPNTKQNSDSWTAKNDCACHSPQWRSSPWWQQADPSLYGYPGNMNKISTAMLWRTTVLYTYRKNPKIADTRKFAVITLITLKVEQDGFSLKLCIQKMQRKLQTV